MEPKQGYKAVLGLVYRAEKRRTLRAGVWVGLKGTEGSPAYPLDV